jgi:hypothetical protein
LAVRRRPIFPPAPSNAIVFISVPSIPHRFEKVFSSALAALEHDLEILAAGQARPGAAQRRARRNVRKKRQRIHPELAACVTRSVAARDDDTFYA